MAQQSKTGGKASKAKAHKASQTKGRKTVKTKRHVAPAAKPRKRRSVSELEAQLQRRTIELNEALEQQAATAEILKIINTSQGNLAPVFDIILEKAHRLCDVSTGALELYEGDIARCVSTRGMNERWEQYLRQGYRITEVLRPAWQSLRPGHVVDMRKLVERFPDEPAYRGFVEIGGLRTFLALPLVKGGIVFGRIVAARAEVRPFTDKQISLLQSFADQAVIAIENAQLFNETKEALERQTATANILKVIAGSPTDVQPVFDAIAESAKRLLASHTAVVTRVIDDVVHLAASTAESEAPAHAAKGLLPYPLSSDRIHARVARTGQVAVTTNAPNSNLPQEIKEFARTVGWRSMLVVPMLRNEIAIGTIGITRHESGSFDDKTVDLLKTFADQAVIAIENARLFNETKEALERQIATADILRVISGSPADVQPVFQAIAEHARLLCKAQVGATTRLDGDMVHLAGVRSMSAGAEEAMRSSFPMPLKLASPNIRRAIVEQVPIQIPDVNMDSDYAHLVDGTQRMGFRSIMSVPLMHEGRSIGTIGVAREEPGLFPDGAVSLLLTFADQAVIAIENVRLYNETKEALEQQKASADILSVISSSVADAQPVFDKILVSCKHLFGGDELDVLLVDEQGQLNIAAYIGDSHDVVAATFPAPLERTPAGRAIRERRVMHWPDLVDGEDVPGVLRKMAKLIGYRSMVFAPMLWEGRGIGAIGVARSTGPFKAKELAMIQTFADQAVIAIQNARLFNETKEALERQTATADILKVIASSPSDLQPVFEAIAERSNRLVDAFQQRFSPWPTV